jgi:serine protease inhibitor
MPTAFAGSADFSGMTTETHLMVSSVIYEALVAVDEEGTEAAAATTAILGDGAAFNETEASFTANRPCLFSVHDRPTGAAVFLGRVLDPE